MLRFILLASFAGGFAVHALTPDNCLFYAPFDGGFDAAQARGSVKATVKGEIPFVPGIRGQGIRIGAPKTAVTYETAANLNLDAGSVSLWLKPETWNEDDSAMRFFFMVNEGEQKPLADGGTFLWLYRFFGRSTYFLVWDSRGYPSLAAADPKQFPDVFKKGEWVHLIGAWNGDELRLYVNGKLQGTRRVGTPRVLRSLASTFTVGTENRANAADTVLDEFRIFDRALTPPEAAALYRFELQATPDQIEMVVVPLPGVKKVRVDVNACARRPGETAGLTAKVSLWSEAATEKPLQEQTIDRFATNHAVAELDTSALAPGEYRVTVNLLDNGKDLAATEATFAIKPPPAWLGSTVGISDKVPEPWTPLVLEENRIVACSGPRRYDLGGALFPKALNTLANDVLAQPITLSGTVNGAPLEPGPVQTTWTLQTPARIEFNAAGTGGGVAVSTASLIEFDGLLWTTLKLTGAGPLKVARLTLDIPLRKEAATLMQTSYSFEETGTVRAWNHRVLNGGQVWLGNEDGGLQVTVPSARNWSNAVRENQIQIIPGADRVTLRLNLIDRETDLAPDAAFSFGLQLTPVRSHPQGWRLWRITPPPGVPGTRFNPFYTEGWALGTSYPIPKPEWEKIYNDETKLGNLATLYLQPFSIWTGMPDYPEFAAEWRTNYCNPPAKPDSEAMPMSFTGVCPHPASWGDYFVTTFCSLYQGKYKDMGWGAVYFDNTPAPACDNADHGCGYLDEFGVRQGESRYLEHRTVQRRFFTALNERWPGKLLFNHESGSLNTMQLAFADGMIDGEHICLALPLDNFNYHKILTLDRMRAEFMGHNFGFVPIFLPEFTRASSGNAEVTNRFLTTLDPPEVLHLLGLLFLHDILPWPAYSNTTPYLRLWAIEDAFGWGDAVEFRPYWKNADLVTVAPADPNLVCSVYRQPGKALLIVMNNTDTDQDVILDLNLAKLGVAAESARDVWKGTSFQGVNYASNPANKDAWINTPVEIKGTEERLPLTAGRLNVSVGRRNFRLLALP